MRTKPSRQHVLNWFVTVCHADYDALLPLTYKELMELRRQYLRNAGLRPRQKLFTKKNKNKRRKLMNGFNVVSYLGTDYLWRIVDEPDGDDKRLMAFLHDDIVHMINERGLWNEIF